MEKEVDEKKLMEEATLALKALKDIQHHPKWEKFSDKPCTMFKIEIQNRFASKGQAQIPFPIEEVIAFLRHEDTLAKLNPKLLNKKTLHKFNDQKCRVVYMNYEGKWPIVSGRDFVNVTMVEKEGDNKYYMASRASSYPHPQVNGVVRAQILTGGYIVEKINQNSTKVTYISDVDIKGSVPAFIKNMLSQNQGQVVSKITPIMQKK